MVEQKDKNKKVQKRQMTRTQTKERKKQDSKQASKVSIVESERRRKSQRERQLLNTDYGVKSEDEGRRETSVQAKSSKNTPLFPHRKFNEFKPPSNFQYLSLLFRCGHRGQNFGIKRPRP